MELGSSARYSLKEKRRKGYSKITMKRGKLAKQQCSLTLNAICALFLNRQEEDGELISFRHRSRF